jgi:serine/threonine protein kinase
MQKDVIVRTKNALQVLREKRLLSMVQPHPLIVGLVSSMQDQNCLYLLQEFINGGDLFHRLYVRTCDRCFVSLRFFAYALRFGLWRFDHSACNMRLNAWHTQPRQGSPGKTQHRSCVCVVALARRLTCRYNIEGVFPASTAQYYAACVTLMLEKLHSMNILYRDLKPENLLLNGQGVLKMVDFGMAKKVTGRTYTLCGTPEYVRVVVTVAVAVTVTVTIGIAVCWCFTATLRPVVRGKHHPPTAASQTCVGGWGAGTWPRRSSTPWATAGASTTGRLACSSSR